MDSDQSVVPHTGVSVYQAMYGRRMAWKYKDQPVPAAALERMLDASVWAPNHRLTEPWRLFVVKKGSRASKIVADQAYEVTLQRSNNPDRAEAIRRAVLEPPIVIYVYCVPGPNEEVTQENYASVICAAYNLSLAGYAEGLAVTWETGGRTRHPELKATLGADPDWELAVMLSVGFPDEAPVSRRTGAKEFVRWLD